MLRRRFFHWQLAALLGVCMAAGGAEPPRKPDANRNAALLYWQVLARLSGLPEAERAVVDGFDKSAPAKLKQYVFDKTGDAARALHRAAAMPRCDWETDVGLSPDAPRAQTRSLCRFLDFRARHQFEQGQPRTAVDDLVAGFAMARHNAADNTGVGMLVGVAIEGILIHTCLEHLHEMDPATLDALQSGLDHMPPRPTWKTILAQDKRFLDEWFLPQFAATSDPDAWKAALQRMYPDPPAGVWPDAPRASKLIERFGTREALVRHLQEGHELLDELAQFPFPPPGKISPTLMAKLEEMPKGIPLFREYCSLQPASYRAYSRGVVQFQLLRAAIAVKRHGPEAIKDYPDPSGDGPFEYRKRKEGFELVSQFKLVNRGWQPMWVKVGPLAKGEVRWNL